MRALAEMTTEEAGRNEGRLRAYLRGAADALAVAEHEQDGAVPIRSLWHMMPETERVDWATGGLDEWVTAVVATFPPLTPAQRHRLAVLLSASVTVERRRDGHVVPAALLRQRRGREREGHPARGPRLPGVDHRRAHPVA